MNHDLQMVDADTLNDCCIEIYIDLSWQMRTILKKNKSALC